ncbi:acyl carrier protein [Streptomyces sp. PmtG]
MRGSCHRPCADSSVGTGPPRRRPPARPGREPGESAFDPLSPGEREAALVELLRADVATALGYPDADALPTGKTLSDLGFDSLTAVQIRNRISTALTVRLPMTVVFEHRTAEELAHHLLGLLDSDPGTGSAPATPAAERPAHTLSSPFRTVSAAGQPVAAMHLIVTASWALPTFTAAQGRAHALPPIRRSHGRPASGRPTVVYYSRPTIHRSRQTAGTSPTSTALSGTTWTSWSSRTPASDSVTPYRRTAPPWRAPRPTTCCGTPATTPS